MQIELGKTYRNWADEFIKIKTTLDETHQNYHDGFRFVGNNGKFYRPDGASNDGCDVYEDVTIMVSGIQREEGRVCDTQEEASNLTDNGPKGPHGWIQWKGTSVCMDIYCRCGYHSHIDAEFAYYVECPTCHRTYVCNGNIELIEYTGPSRPHGAQPKMEEGPVDADNWDCITVDNKEIPLQIGTQPKIENKGDAS